MIQPVSSAPYISSWPQWTFSACLVSARADFEDHGAALAGRVVILLNAVDDTLAGGEVDYALAADGVGNGATLGRVFAFRFNGNRIVAKDVQVAFGVGLLEQLATLSGGGDGVKHAGVGDARLGVVGDKLVSVCCDANAGIASSYCHKTLSVRPVRAINSSCAGGRSFYSGRKTPRNAEAGYEIRAYSVAGVMLASGVRLAHSIGDGPSS